MDSELWSLMFLVPEGFRGRAAGCVCWRVGIASLGWPETLRHMGLGTCPQTGMKPRRQDLALRQEGTAWLAARCSEAPAVPWVAWKPTQWPPVS